MYASSNEATEPLNFLYEIINKLIRHDINFGINLNYNDGFVSLYTQIVPREDSNFDYGEFIKNMHLYCERPSEVKEVINFYIQKGYNYETIQQLDYMTLYNEYKKYKEEKNEPESDN